MQRFRPLYRFGHLNEAALYYVMPLLRADLATWARPAEPSKVRDLLADLLDALIYAENLGIQLREFKPERVFFDAKGRAQLSGFGALMPSEAPARCDTDNLYRLAEMAFKLLTENLGYIEREQKAVELKYWQSFFARALKSQLEQRFENAAQMKLALSTTKAVILPMKMAFIEPKNSANG